MAHDYYCVIKPRDPKWNPGHIPCQDAELRNCEGCFIKDEADREAAKKMKQKLNRRADNG